jgi:hypothetical protein
MADGAGTFVVNNRGGGGAGDHGRAREFERVSHG